MQVLAISSSRVGGGAFLSAAAPMIESFLGQEKKQVAFLPFAAADNDYEGYAAKVREGLSSLPHTLEVVTPENARSVVVNCDVVMVGGGNTFKLLHDIYSQDLFTLIQQKVSGGTPYIGWSAGANLTGRTISTTNDMPIIQPQSFTAFGFFPFQINPHYYNVTIDGFHGETRDQRLEEFLLVNPGVPVVGLPEGTALQLQDDRLQFLGTQEAVLFEKQNAGVLSKKTVSSGADLSFLLQ
ncbi:MAG TPA: dipeptidase PepE [Flavisolibacter sp.]|nr:dipeptidase PepE [Flavisolibacter sp.]